MGEHVDGAGQEAALEQARLQHEVALRQEAASGLNLKQASFDVEFASREARVEEAGRQLADVRAALAEARRGVHGDHERQQQLETMLAKQRAEHLALCSENGALRRRLEEVLS